MMKKILTLFLFCLISQMGRAQSPGDILFVGFFADNPEEAFAFLVVEPLAGGTVLYFTDEEWNGMPIGSGGSFTNTSEGYIEWTAPAGGVEAGTVVLIDDTGGNGSFQTTDSASTGTITAADGSMAFTGSNEQLYAYIGAPDNPTGFVAALFNDNIADGSNSINGTGLTAGVDVMELGNPGGDADADGAVFDYAGSSCASGGMVSACLSEILDVNNWTLEDGAADNVNESDVFQGMYTVFPVDLIHFEAYAKGNFVNTEWTTTLEINNDYFILERSSDGIDFKEIARIEGSGNSSNEENYLYTDRQPELGMNYYRLVQVDYDGAKNIHHTISVRFGKEQHIVLYPNPTSNEFFIAVNDDWLGEVRINIFNNGGKLIQQQTINSIYNNVAVNIEALNTGIYTVQIINGNQTYNKRLIKQ